MVLDDLARLLSQKESVQGDELRQMLSAATPGTVTASPIDLSLNTTGKTDQGNVI
jgi:cell division protease FtsH